MRASELQGLGIERAFSIFGRGHVPAWAARDVAFFWQLSFVAVAEAVEAGKPTQATVVLTLTNSRR